MEGFKGQNARRFAKAILTKAPAARASIKGDRAHWGLHGSAAFYPTASGTLVVAEVFGLPGSGAAAGGKDGVFGFHIHEGASCSGDAADPFKNTGTHYNPAGRAHPWHAGDMPPLFAGNGYAFLAFYTDRFRADEVVGRTVVIHDMPDDFTTQPAGNAGKKIGCGEIRTYA